MSILKHFQIISKSFSRHVPELRNHHNPKNSLKHHGNIKKYLNNDIWKYIFKQEAKLETNSNKFKSYLKEINRIKNVALKEFFINKLLIAKRKEALCRTVQPKLIPSKQPKYILDKKLIDKIQQYAQEQRNFTASKSSLDAKFMTGVQQYIKENRNFVNKLLTKSIIPGQEFKRFPKDFSIKPNIKLLVPYPETRCCHFKNVETKNPVKFNFEADLLSKIQQYIENNRQFTQKLFILSKNPIEKSKKNQFEAAFLKYLHCYTSNKKIFAEKLLEPRNITRIQKLHGQNLELYSSEIDFTKVFPSALNCKITDYSCGKKKKKDIPCCQIDKPKKQKKIESPKKEKKKKGKKKESSCCRIEKKKKKKESCCKIDKKKKKSKSKKNFAAVLYGINDMKLEDWPMPEIRSDEVLLQIECVGICGSDVHYLVNGKIGDFVLEKPMVMGHEAAGTVVKTGKKVKGLHEGDRVAIEPGVPCRYCYHCKKGRYNLCPDVIFCATPPNHGNLVRYFAHVADFCYKLPDHVSFEEGAMLEPLSVGIYACKRGRVHMGSTVFVSGAGPVGLLTVLTAKAFGASAVIVTDVQEHCLKVAKSLGADFPMLIKKDEKSKDIAKKIKDALSGELVSVSIDCCGSEQSVKACIRGTKSGGRAVMVGMDTPKVNVPILDAVCREVDILGSFRYLNNYPTALHMVDKGIINVKPLITHHFPMQETKKAFEVRRTGEGNAIKVIIHVNPKWKPKNI